MIKENVRKILKELPCGVELVAAAKGRNTEEIQQAVEAGVKIVGENYLQEAKEAYRVIGARVRWHFIGHLQKNKIKKALKIFDMIETVDSQELAEEINEVCAGQNKIMPVLVEINSGREEQKFGVLPDEAQAFIKKISCLKNIRVMGLMTMGPIFSDPENIRMYFKETKKVFEQIKSLNLERVKMQYLSMGMSDSYQVAIQEGANMVRIGGRIFGEK